MILHTLPFIAAWLLTAPVQETPIPIAANQMAYGIELTPTSEQGVQTLLLPEQVYRNCTSPDLSDVRVFNGAGEWVPHALRPWIQATVTPESSLPLPVFPVYGKASTPAGDLNLEFKRSSEGSVLEVSAGAENYPDKRLVAHVIDALKVSGPLTSIQVTWAADDTNFLLGFALEGSPDLATWRTIVPRASFARLNRDGARLEQSRMDFPPNVLPYLRLRWLGEAPQVEIVEVSATLASHKALPERRSVRLAGTQRPGEPLVFDFPSPGPLSPIAVQVHLPEPNSLVRAAVQQGVHAQGPWRNAQVAHFFRLGGDPEHHNAPHSIQSSANTHWALEVESNGGGLGSGTPDLELFYYPHQLAFLTRGEGPYTLAFGLHGAQATGFQWSDLQPMLLTHKDTPAQTVTLGALQEFAGPSALLAPAPPSTTLKRTILWAVLIAGVFLLGFFSMRLLRQLPEPG